MKKKQNLCVYSFYRHEKQEEECEAANYRTWIPLGSRLRGVGGIDLNVSMNNFCIALFLFIFLQQAGIIVVSTKGEQLILELRNGRRANGNILNMTPWFRAQL